MDSYSYISNAEPAYIDGLYQQFQADPESVEPSWRQFFEGFEFSLKHLIDGGSNGAAGTDAASSKEIKEIAVRNLIHAYRTRGHLKATTNPVRERRQHKAVLEKEAFGLTDADLDTTFQMGEILDIGPASLRKIVQSLDKIFAGTIGVEYKHIRNQEAIDWFEVDFEDKWLNYRPRQETKEMILHKLNEAVVFENFLHTKYIGQKRFSLEGGETTIVGLNTAINHSAEFGVEEVVIGMAHRGRLNVLANIMGKTYEQIFNEFEGGAVPDQTMGDGDVKYHLGFSSQVETPSGKPVRLNLAPNPSHLEAVGPVVEGYARAKGEALYGGDHSKILPILIHGDAAVAAQGVVYEVTQMSRLAGYTTAGTIHFVINNQVGFTTDYDDARSSIYCSDVAKVVDAPVFHVNGDDPEAVHFCMKLAVEYRARFGTDIWIDMVCYRRHGHNESDEPKFTQPNLYNLISKHPNPREVYNEKLTKNNELDKEVAEKLDKEFRQMLQDRLNQVKQKPLPYEQPANEKAWDKLRRAKPEDFEKSPDTAITEEVYDKVAKALVTMPKNFKPLRQIEKQFKQRREMMLETGQLNWAAAELLAYGSLLVEGTRVRITGQDTQRGTFSHRHAVIRDANSNEPYSNLEHISPDQAPFSIYNSLLSEFGALGYEFGYAMADPSALVVWEAQFGDFVNGAQVMIDQFIAASESKWQRMNGLVMLLPHGYEGQGPEHSSARPERFLQLAAEYNIIVANATTPANLFHMLRRQMVWPFRKPLIVMSPKSLLRHPQVVSEKKDLLQGRFQEVIDDTYATASRVKRVILCTGKVYYDLLERQQKDKRKDVALVRVEQLFPLPQTQLDKVLGRYKNAELKWLQEEPRNMGYWTYMLRSFTRPGDISYLGRKEAASPATGYAKVHAREQEQLIEDAFTL